ncbi:RSC chromatin remodeling complex ATPase component [Pichia californica]|uniref:RSC chromatin remodeling complex ATPase component n=1 Tax=Pichia californica TaxID=460514 RepID=A0A9P6WKC5_9ASCO|nr:RSC chromatin remodeling complex ATPase component [[Candida] californica]KAG0688556.1 RSC chromatin remodeling complex ATPase component [[Candida] californica]
MSDQAIPAVPTAKLVPVVNETASAITTTTAPSSNVATSQNTDANSNINSNSISNSKANDLQPTTTVIETHITPQSQEKLSQPINGKVEHDDDNSKSNGDIKKSSGDSTKSYVDNSKVTVSPATTLTFIENDKFNVSSTSNNGNSATYINMIPNTSTVTPAPAFTPTPSFTPTPAPVAVLAPTPVPIVLPKIPFPNTRNDVELLLNHFAKLETANANPLEKLAILKTLSKVDKIVQKSNNNKNSIKESWNSNSESIDINLLKNQLLGLQLLSKDLDLPTELSLEYLKSGTKSPLTDDINSLLNNENEKSINNSNNNNNISNASKSSISIPLDDYDSKAEMFGIIPNKPIVNPKFNVVGLPEMEDSIKLKIDTRIKELENLPSNLGSYDFNKFENDLKYSNDKIIDNVDQLKIDALIELKGLKLLPLQKQLRNHLLIKAATNTIYHDENLNDYSVFKTWKRTYCVHPKQKVVQTAKLAEKLLQQQLQERKKILENIHNEKVSKLVEFATNSQNEIARNQLKRFQLGKVLHQFHQQAERDESKKFERNAKQRLLALKANDEEAYIKLLDQTKDKRITHLLKQTNSFLDTLANAVKIQQNESKILTQVEKGEPIKPSDVEVEGEGGETEDEKREKINYYEVAHKVKEHVTKQPDILVGGTLKEYQIKGLEWMVSLYNNHLNGILADEMGLGKTIQSIALITHLIEQKNETGKFLIVVPLSTITNWTLEFEQWAPSLKTVVYKGSQQQRKELQYQIRSGDFTVLLTTFEYVIRDRPMLSKFKWAHMLIDEGHRLKNTGSKLFQTLTNYYHTRNRLILTGTPLQNNLPELWALLNFILPKVFNSVQSFDEWFNTPFANTGHQEKLELSEEESLLIIRRLHKVLRPFLLRRLKKDVAKDLPDKIEKVVKCKFSSLQSRIYKQLLTHNALFIGQGTVGATKSGLKGLNNKIMQLRKACNHPFVFEEVETVVNPDKSTTDLIWRASGKFELLDRVLPKLKRTGHRVLIFFQMTQVMDIMEDYLRFRNLKYMRLDGSTKADDRQDMLKEFNAPDSDYFCFLLSTRAGGLGLNLQTADTVIIFDTDWNPHQDLQAQDRAHRIGQKNEVRILRLITSDSIEEMILDRAHQKLDIDGKVIQAGKFDNKSSAEEQEAYLKRLIEEEKDKNNEAEIENFGDEEINEMLARNENELEVFHQIDVERAQDDKLRGNARLVSDDEVPEVFKEDMSVHLEEKEDTGGRRVTKKVVYDDGLTEEQWLQAMDNDDDSVEDAIARKQQRIEKLRKTRERKSNNNDGDDDDDPTLDEEKDDNIENDNEDVINSKSSKRELDNVDDDSDEEVYEEDLPSRKRQRLSSRAPTPVVKENKKSNVKAPLPIWVQRAYIVLNELEKCVDEDGNNVGGVFAKLPSRKFYSDYYKIIKHVVSLGQMKKQLDTKKIFSWEEFLSECKQMITNAHIYNEEGSWVVKCADIIEKRMNELIQQWEEEDINAAAENAMFSGTDDVNKEEEEAV